MVVVHFIRNEVNDEGVDRRDYDMLDIVRFSLKLQGCTRYRSLWSAALKPFLRTKASL